VLEVVRRHFCEHIAVLPEAASILFGGGFPRKPGEPARRAAQHAIYAVQRQLERIPCEEGHAAVVLCDRGTIDGLACWPGSPESFWSEVGSSRELELARYAAVIHLRTPRDGHGYNLSNPSRIETAREASESDLRIERAWDGHPRRVLIEDTEEFLSKVAHAIEVIRAEMPPCCRTHPVPEVDAPSGSRDASR
jgi:hypothetical protein